MFCRAVVLALVVIAFGYAIAGAPMASAEPAPFVPSFWDPAQRPDKPDLGGLRVIRFMTEDDYPPMHFLTEDGRLAGFNVDLARALCEELAVACTVQARRWDTLLPSLAEGRGDAVLASLRATPTLRRDFALTAAYLRTPARFAVRTAAAAAVGASAAAPATPDVSPRGLAGRSVAVVENTAHAAYLAAFFPAAQAKPFSDLDTARDALRRGEVDALFADGLTLAVWLNSTEGAACCAFAGGPYTESRYFGEGVAIALRRSEPVLRRALDWALWRLAQKGTYAELYLRYFPVGFY
jgi:polar amino acid transport system substrate-binding protein